MNKAILIHGWPEKEEFFDPETPSPSNNQWIPWIQKQLGMRGITAQAPEMPDAYQPVYEKWERTFEHLEIDEDTVLVGHSCGGGFIVRWLGETGRKVGKVVLVAPWLDPQGELKTGFFDFEIDQNITSRTKGITVLYSTDDYEFIAESVNILKEKVSDVTVREFSGKGHFCISDLGTDQFPELLEEILKP